MALFPSSFQLKKYHISNIAIFERQIKQPQLLLVDNEPDS